MKNLSTLIKLSTLLIIGGGTVGAAVGVTEAQMRNNDINFDQNYVEASDSSTMNLYFEVIKKDDGYQWYLDKAANKITMHYWSTNTGDKHIDLEKAFFDDAKYSVTNLYKINLEKSLFENNDFGFEIYVDGDSSIANHRTRWIKIDKEFNKTELFNGKNYFKVKAEQKDNQATQWLWQDTYFLGDDKDTGTILKEDNKSTFKTQRIWVNVDDHSLINNVNAADNWTNGNVDNHTAIYCILNDGTKMAVEVTFIQNDNTDGQNQRWFAYADVPTSTNSFRVIYTWANIKFPRYSSILIENNSEQIAKVNYIVKENNAYNVKTVKATDYVQVGVEFALKGLEGFTTCSTNPANGYPGINYWKNSFVGTWTDLNIFDSKTISDYDYKTTYDLTTKQYKDGAVKSIDANAGEKIRLMTLLDSENKGNKSALNSYSDSSSAIIISILSVASLTVIVTFVILLKKNQKVINK